MIGATMLRLFVSKIRALKVNKDLGTKQPSPTSISGSSSESPPSAALASPEADLSLDDPYVKIDLRISS